MAASLGLSFIYRSDLQSSLHHFTKGINLCNARLFSHSRPSSSDSPRGSCLASHLGRPLQRSSRTLCNKLDNAKGVLEGLATEDYEKIARDAQALSLLSLESDWNVITTEEYLEQSSDFRRAVNVITEAAREKDVNRAALGYVNLTVRCVECHSYLRKNPGLKR